MNSTDVQHKKKSPAISIYPDPVPEGMLSSLTLPLKRAGNLILLEVMVDGIRGNFILDTGAPHLVLNTTYFRKLNTYGEVYAAGITGRAEQGEQVRVDSLDFGGILFRNVDADRINLGHLEEKKGVRILGLLGLNIFKYLELQINMRENTVSIYRLNRNGGLIEPDSLHQVVPAHTLELESESGLLILNARINNKKIRFYLDTGAESCILHSGASKKVFESFALKSTVKLNGSGGKTIEVATGYLSNIQLGFLRLRRIPVTVANLNGLSGLYQTHIDGMLGYEFLNAGIISINQFNSSIYIWEG